MPQINKGLTAGFGDNSPLIDIEYMDSKRLYDKTSVALFYQSLSYKIHHRPPYNLIITSDDNALNFLLHYGDKLFPKIPVVFLGLNNKDLAIELASHPNPQISGVVEAVSVEKNIQ